MTTRTPLLHFAHLLLISSAIGMLGCASSPTVKRTAVIIDSEPRGATVRVTGKPIGVTPLTADIATVFPEHWTAKVETDEAGFAFYRRMETVEISKDGCELFSKRYMAADLAADILATLRCDPNYAAPAAPATTTTSGAPIALPLGAEQRLKSLEELRGKGLINDDEYRDQRLRILNSQ